MSYHVRFYTKTGRSFEEAKEICLLHLHEAIRLSLKYKYLYSEEETKKFISVFKRQITMIKKGGLQKFILNHHSQNLLYLKQQYYICSEEYVNLFRTAPKGFKYLYSLKQTLKFVKNNECDIFDDTFIRLAEFWQKYPDGVIEVE